MQVIINKLIRVYRPIQWRYDGNRRAYHPYTRKRLNKEQQE